MCSVYIFPSSKDLGFVASAEFKMKCYRQVKSCFLAQQYLTIVLGIHMVQSVMIAIKVSTHICYQHCIKVFLI